MLDESDLLLDCDHPLIEISSTDESYPSKNQTTVDEEKLKNLNKKYGPINKIFVKESGSSKKIEKEGIGHSAIIVEAGKGKKKSSRNGKVGINKRMITHLIKMLVEKHALSVVVLIILPITAKLFYLIISCLVL